MNEMVGIYRVWGGKVIAGKILVGYIGGYIGGQSLDDRLLRMKGR